MWHTVCDMGGSEAIVKKLVVALAAALILASPDTTFAAGPTPGVAEAPRAQVAGPQRGGIKIGRLQIGFGLRGKVDKTDGTVTKFKGFIWNPNRQGKGGFGRGTTTIHDPNQGSHGVTSTSTISGGPRLFTKRARVTMTERVHDNHTGAELMASKTTIASRGSSLFRRNATATIEHQAVDHGSGVQTSQTQTFDVKKSFWMRRPQKSTVVTTEHETHGDGPTLSTTRTATTTRSGNLFARKTNHVESVAHTAPGENGGTIRDFKRTETSFRDPRLPFGKRIVDSKTSFGRTEKQADGARFTESTRVTDSRTSRRGRVLTSQQSEQNVNKLHVPGQGTEIERSDKFVVSTDKKGNQTQRVVPGSTTSR